MSWFVALSTDWRLIRKLSNNAIKGLYILQCQKNASVLLRMIPESEMWSTWGWGQNQVDEADFFLVMPTYHNVIMLLVACAHYDWFSVAHCWGEHLNGADFLFPLNLKNLGLLYPGFCWLKTDYWTKLKFTFGHLLSDEEWKWSSSGLCLGFLIKDYCQTFYLEIPSDWNG